MKKQVVKDKKINGALAVHSSQYESTAIPSSWKIAMFVDVATVTDYVANGSFASLRENVKYREEPNYAILIRFTDYVKNWKRNYVYVDKDAYDFLTKSSLQPGDVVIANVGDPGRVFRVPNLGCPMTLGPNSVLVKGRDGVEKGFIFYFFMSPWGQDLIASITTGTAQKKFNKTGLRATYIPIAPLDDQKRIVAEIEKQFSRLDEAVANLKRVKANLKRYKAAVLKAAVEGKLTEEWRRTHRDVEPASELLKRILTERKNKWKEAELAKMKAKGKKPTDDAWKKKYEEPESSDNLSIDLPTTWTAATIQQLSELVQYGSSAKTNETGNGIPVLRMGNIFEGELVLNELKYLPKSHDEFPELLLKSNDLLFNRTNSPELVGKVAVYAGKPATCSFASYLIRVRFNKSVNSKFVSYFINSTYGRQWVKSVVTQQVGQANVNGTKLQALSIPLPSYEEQLEIVLEMEKRFSAIGEMDREVSANLIRGERLRQSILQRAFQRR